MGSQPGLIPPPNDSPILDWLLDPLVPPLAAEATMNFQQPLLAVDQSPETAGSISHQSVIWDAGPLPIFSPPLPDHGVAPPPATPAIVDPRNINAVLEVTAHHTNVAVNQFSCPLCFRAHTTKRTLHRHLWTHYRKYAQENNIPSEYGECPVCHRNMRKDNLKRHADT